MNWNDIQSHWPAYVPRLLGRWPDLDENTLLATDGELDHVANHLAEVDGSDAAAARAALGEWSKGAEPADAMMDPTRDNERIMASAADIPAGEEALDDDKRFGDDNLSATPINRNDG